MQIPKPDEYVQKMLVHINSHHLILTFVLFCFVFSLFEKCLDLEVELIRAKQQISQLETKLQKRTNEVQTAKMEASKLKHQNKKIETAKNLPTIQSDVLNVSSCIF